MSRFMALCQVRFGRRSDKLTRWHVMTLNVNSNRIFVEFTCDIYNDRLSDWLAGRSDCDKSNFELSIK